jgi:hypothetical protein
VKGLSQLADLLPFSGMEPCGYVTFTRNCHALKAEKRGEVMRLWAAQNDPVEIA